MEKRPGGPGKRRGLLGCYCSCPGKRQRQGDMVAGVGWTDVEGFKSYRTKKPTRHGAGHPSRG